MPTLRRLLLALLATLPMAAAGGAAGEAAPTVLLVSSERLTDLVLGHAPLRHVARLGFGTAQRPWHAWFGGSPELQSLVHLPGYRAGTPVRLEASMLIGNRFGGRAWPDAFAALASFDHDGNGIVEGAEMRELWIWVDFDGNGRLADRDDALRPASFYYGGFDLRGATRERQGHARAARQKAFSALVPYGTRVHLLELGIGQSWGAPLEGLLAPRVVPPASPADAAHPLAGRWRWTITDEGAWTDATRPWGKTAGGELLLAVRGDAVHGVAQMTGPHEDRINLPLQGRWRDGRATWTSVSPLGLTRSEVRLESLYGRPVLRARAFGNRNGKVREWTWEARHVGPLE